MKRLRIGEVGDLFSPRNICTIGDDGDAGDGGGGGDGGEGGDDAGDDAGQGSGDGAGAEGEDKGDSDLRRQLAQANRRVQELLTESRSRKEKLKQFGDATPEEVSELRKLKEERERKDREARGLYEQQLEKERSKTNAAEKKATDTEAKFHRTLIQRDIMSGAASQRALEAAMKPAPGDTRAQIVVVTEHLFEYDEEAGQTFHRTEKNADGTRMTPDQFFAKTRGTEFALYFASKVMNGAGSGPGDGPGAGAGGVKIWKDDPARVTKAEKASKDGKPFLIVADRAEASV